MTRRRLLQSGAGVAIGGLTVSDTAIARELPSVYGSLGIKPVINAAGTFTALGGSVMPPEVVTAWTEAARHFVDLVDLQNRVGDRIAKLLGVEAAVVTTGAAGAILLGCAAAVTGGDRKRIAKLPDTGDGRNEVIIQKAHHSCYDNQLTDVGVKLIDVVTASDVKKAINKRTAMMFFMNMSDGDGKIGRKEWIELARDQKIPTLIDAAADVPPIDRIAEYFKMGFDLIAISGGKAIRGPNDTGLLLGRKDLIEAAKLNANPHCGTIGRMMKVGKEDVVASLVAVERFAKMDHAAEMKEIHRKLDIIEAAVKDIATVQTERITPAIANHVPHLQIDWDPKRIKTTREKVTRELSAGDPSIRIGRVSGTGDKGILVSALTIQNGEEQIVATRIAAILKQAST